jgi:hypothetical protein
MQVIRNLAHLAHNPHLDLVHMSPLDLVRSRM